MTTELGGRPKVVTTEVLQKLEYAFSIGCTDVEACFYADIAAGTLYNYQTANPEFLERKNQLKSQPILRARKSVYDKLEEDADLSLKFLERKCKDEFGLKSTTAHEGSLNITGVTRTVIDPKHDNPENPNT